jgi:drug/metabolite transporter (DMT)-like permease
MERHSGTGALVAVAVSMNVVGNFFLSLGMHQVGEIITASPLPYLRALLNPWVAGGVILLAVWLISQLSLLSRADLSYVMPVTASAYILAAILGQVFLHEHISRVRWLGIAAIAAGVMVVGRTEPRTTESPLTIVCELEEQADEVGIGPADRDLQYLR